jgi:hypothetical protein
MPNYCLSYQLDFAVVLFKQKYKSESERESAEEKNRKKWARLALESSQKKAMRMARGK